MTIPGRQKRARPSGPWPPGAGSGAASRKAESRFGARRRRGGSRCSAFSLFEVLLALALFTIAAVSLAEAVNLIGLTVAESVEASERREHLRAALLEATRSPIRGPETWTEGPDEAGLIYRVEIAEATLRNREAATLDGLYEVTVTALRRRSGGGEETLEAASALVNPSLFLADR